MGRPAKKKKDLTYPELIQYIEKLESNINILEEKLDRHNLDIARIWKNLFGIQRRN